MKMKKTALLALPVLALAVTGGAFAGVTQTASAATIEQPVAVCRGDESTSGIDNFLPDDDVFGQSGDYDYDCDHGDCNRPRPQPRRKDRGMDEGFSRQRPSPESGTPSPDGDVYFIIYGHVPLPPAPMPIPDNSGGEIPEAELG